MARRAIHIGTSGWTYDDWSGAFYPAGVRGAERLAYYATRFDTVEVNATFYRLPTDAMVKAWNRRLPRDFHLVLKGSRFITHRKKLVGIDEALALFFERIDALERVRVVLWQLAPSLHRDVARLDAFLAVLPGSVRHAVEFRHESWWSDDVAAALRRRKAAFVAISHPRLPADVISTADFLYLRFHGLGRDLYRYDYSDRELEAWGARIAPYLGRRSLYAFFNNDAGAKAPKNAARLRELLACD